MRRWKMWKYFDLNLRTCKGFYNEEVKFAAGEGSEIEKIKPSSRDINPFSFLNQIVMYFGTFIGVFFSEYVKDFKAGNNVVLSITWLRILIVGVVAIIIIPPIYEKFKVHPTSPFIVRFGLFVQNGIFWQAIVNVIGKVTG
jgi:hypothetical protein